MRHLLLCLALTACFSSKGTREPYKGFIVPGSITVDGNVRTFRISDHGHETHARLTGPAPDCLKDNAEVQLVGGLRDGTIEVTEIRCVPPPMP